jgi:palmitoyltransferase
MFSRISSVHHALNQTKDLSLNSYEFFEAIKGGEIEKCRQFFYNPNIKAWELKDENNYTVLHFSAFKNNYDLTILILEEIKKGLGINSSKKISEFINEKNKEGITALHYSVINGNIAIFKLLKKYGANLEAVTNTGKNIMHIAAESNQPSMMIYLYLNEAQDISSVDENGSTPLHWACYYKAEECVNYLLHLNVDINAQDKENFTPLNIAVSNNKVSLVKLLLRKGADKKIANKYNQLPIDIAKKKHYAKIMKILTSGYNPLCSTEIPDTYVKPTDAYKRVILLMLIICEIIIFILVLPFLDSLAFYILNFIFFGLGLVSYFILLWSEPGYQKNKELVRDCGGEDNYKCLKKLVEDGEDLKKYCPVCYVLKANNIKHCFICNKCVKDLSHHCFWFNKCIGKKNRIIYIIFLVCTFLHCVYTIFICSNLIFDTVNIPYERFLPTWIYLGIDRGFRVLGANIVSIISVISSYPIFFMFMVEMFKLCGLLGKKNKDFENLQKEEKIETLLTDESKSIEMQNQRHDSLWSDRDPEENEDEEKNKINIPNKNFPIGVDRDTIQEEEKENIEDENENIIENNNEEENK